MKIEEINVDKKVYADFNNLDALTFCGVYVLYDPNNGNEIVYVGSSYVRGIKTRIMHHTSFSNSNNLAREIIMLDAKIAALPKEKQLHAAIEKIKTFKILAIEHQDLEYQIIKETQPKYNRYGNLEE